jgi:hypothetical protein
LRPNHRNRGPTGPHSEVAYPRASRSLAPLKMGLVLLLVVSGFVCAFLHGYLDTGIRDLALKEGFTLFPGPMDGDTPIYWINQPGHLLRIVEYTDTDIGDAIFSIGATLFLAFLAWLFRESIVPFIIVPLGIGFNILVTGAFSAPAQFPLDFSVDQDRGMFVAGTTAVNLCIIEKVIIDERTGGRGGPSYWLVAQLKSGGTADLSVFDTDEAAIAVSSQVSAALMRVRCTPS